MPFPSDIATYNESYIVDNRTAFRPYEAPATFFKDPQYCIWRFTAQSIPKLMWKHPGEFRKRVDSLPMMVFSAAFNDRPQWRLAYTCLTFIAHAYCWGASAGPDLTADSDDFEGPVDVLPPQIAVPLKHISTHLGIEPGMTFSSIALWNWERKLPIMPGQPERRENLKTIFSFTGTKEEEHFVLTGVMVETAGGVALNAALEASQAVEQADAAKVQAALEKLTPAIDKCREYLNEINEDINPEVFWNRVVPYLTGFGKNALPNGVLYRTSEDYAQAGERFSLSGASAAQTAIFPALDALLGIDHTEEYGTKYFGFRARVAMPRPHVRYIEDLERLPQISEFVASHKHNKSLVKAYAHATTALKAFQNTHITVVSLFITGPSNRVPQTIVKDSFDTTKLMAPIAGVFQKKSVATRKRSIASAPMGQ